MALCLVVEDDSAQRGAVEVLLRSAGYQTVGAGSGAEARAQCHDLRPEIALVDLGLPDADGLELIPELLALTPLSRVVVLTGRNSVSAAVEALRLGARHYLVKPWDAAELLLVLGREARAVDLAESRVRGPSEEVYWGRSRRVRQLLAMLHKLARSPLTPVLIEGETGTGKEIVARELHRMGGAAGPFIALNCASVPTELLESELFGHERGAFTGAEARRRGLVEVARDGTLFLDEIGELAPNLQPKLLRFLQDFGFRRVGGREELTSPCRIVAATHRNLEAMLADGGFREDLFFRLAIVRLAIPPLRERPADIVPLAGHLLERVAQTTGAQLRGLATDAERTLVAHAWPGNIRELRNRLERALVMADGDLLHAADLDLPTADRAANQSAPDAAADTLRRVMAESGWNVSRAATRLGRPRHWLRYRLKKYDIRRP